MSEYEQTQRRFEKLKNTFDKLIEQNSYKNLRTQIVDLKIKCGDLYKENAGLKKRFDAQERILKVYRDKEDQVSKP